MFENKQVILWDTEFTSWEGCHEDGWNNEEGEYKEIIQIGAVKIDTDSMEEIDEFNRYVKPQINPELSEYIKELTRIKQEEVDRAEKFSEVLKDFLKWSSGINKYSYFNDLDVVKINQELYDTNLRLDESEFKDITRIFRRHSVPVSDWSSGNIAKYFDPGIEILPQHDALNDSKNTRKALELMNTQ